MKPVARRPKTKPVRLKWKKCGVWVYGESERVYAGILRHDDGIYAITVQVLVADADAALGIVSVSLRTSKKIAEAKRIATAAAQLIGVHL